MKKTIRQTYWPKKISRVPISKQRNDDDRLGYEGEEVEDDNAWDRLTPKQKRRANEGYIIPGYDG